MTPDAFVRDALRRLPDLSHRLEPCVAALDAGEPALRCAEYAAVEMLDWARDAVSEPDWDVVFDLLDVWLVALASLDERDDLALILTGVLGLLNVPMRRYGADALERASPASRRRMLDAPTRVTTPFSFP